MTDDEILASDKLSFQEKRARLYLLGEAASGLVQEAVKYGRDQANYQRTRQRLSGWGVKFTPEAEQEFIRLTDRVDKSLIVAAGYSQSIEAKLSAARKLEPALLNMIRSGSLNQSLRQQYLALPTSIETAALRLGSFQVSYGDNRLIVTAQAQSSLLRWQVDCGILFDELVAVRSSQELLRAAGEIDEPLSRLLSSLPADVTSTAGFSQVGAPPAGLKAVRDAYAEVDARYQKAKDRETELANERKRRRESITTTNYSPFDHRDLDDIVADQEKTKQTIRDLEIERSSAQNKVNYAETQHWPKGMSVGLELTAAERQAFIRSWEKDASVLERALEGRLLDYPWPWAVQRVKVEHQPFIVTTKETP